MAGSPSQSHLSGPFTDPILSARLEALKQLADGLTDRVAVMDQEYNLIYGNEPAWGRIGEAQRLICWSDPGQFWQNRVIRPGAGSSRTAAAVSADHLGRQV